MPELEVVLWTEDRDEPITYTVAGDLKRPGEAIEQAREAAGDDGHDAVELKEVRLAEPAQ